MPRPVSARIDHSNVLTGQSPSAQVRDRLTLVASVGPHTPALHRIDMIRLDAAALTLHAITSLRGRYACPALLDLPGPRTRREVSLLTTTELLVFASAEQVEWVGLRDVEGVAQVDRARGLMHPATQIAVSVHSPDVIHGPLRDIVSLADAVILDGPDLAREVGVANLREHLRCGIRTANEQGRPCLVAGGLLTSMQRDPSPTLGQLERLWSHLEDGCGGFVLTEETLGGEHPQSCVDILRLMDARAPSPRTRAKGSARVGGEPGLGEDLGEPLPLG